MFKPSTKRVLISSFLVYTAIMLLTCLVLGISHMFARAVTLDSVRSIDFQIIMAAFNGMGLNKEIDRQSIQNVIRNLASKSGYAFYPLAVVDGDDCLENSLEPRICSKFPNSRTLRREIDNGAVTERYEVKTLKTDKDEHFFIGQIRASEAWLIGDAGQYLSVGDKPFGNELAFAREAGEYFTPRGFKKMWQKSKWAWFACFTLFIIAWLWYAYLILKEERQHQKLAQENSRIEKALAKFKAEIALLTAQRDSLEEELLSELTQSDEEKGQLRLELDTITKSLHQAREDRDMLALERDDLEKQINDSRRSRNKRLQREETEDAFSLLHEIKKLWLTDPRWIERYSIEEGIAAEALGRAPFTEFIALVRMEWFLKTMCKRKGLQEPQDNEQRIKALENANLISKKNANLLHEARIARNRWFHDGQYPDRELVNRLLDFLEKQKNPEVRPKI